MVLNHLNDGQIPIYSWRSDCSKNLQHLSNEVTPNKNVHVAKVSVTPNIFQLSATLPWGMISHYGQPLAANSAKFPSALRTTAIQTPDFSTACNGNFVALDAAGDRRLKAGCP